VHEQRLDAVGVIGQALEMAAQGVGTWRASELLELPFSTVRDWRTRCRRRAPELLAKLARTGLSVGAQIGKLPGSVLAAMVAVLKAVWARFRERQPALVGSGGSGTPCAAGGPWPAKPARWGRRPAPADGMPTSLFRTCLMAPDPAEAMALFRYRVIAEALSERLTPAERGLLVRGLTARAHEMPDGSRKEFSRATLDRWSRPDTY
jgi:hypothetical protein